MNPERIALAISAVAILALGGWNLQLNGQIAELQQAAAPVEVEVEATALTENRPVVTKGPHARHKAREGRREDMGTAHHGGEAETLVVEKAETERSHERRRPDFAAMRTEMETQTIEMVEAFGTQSDWEPEVTENVLGILLETGEAVGQIWSEQHSEESETSHYQARKETHALRAEADEEIATLIGQEAADELGEQLFTARRESMRRNH